MNDDIQEYNRAAQAYVDKFGYFPIGPGSLDPTTEQLKKAVETGEEIRESIPPGADA